MTGDEIARAVCDELDRRHSEGRRVRDGMTEAEHSAQHAFVEILMDRERQRLEVWRDLHKHVVKFGTLSVITALGAACYYYVKHIVLAP